MTEDEWDKLIKEQEEIQGKGVIKLIQEVAEILEQDNAWDNTEHIGFGDFESKE